MSKTKHSDWTKLRDQLRVAVADYMYSEGCSCCQNEELHREDTKLLGELLDVPKFAESDVPNFRMFRSRK